MSRDDDDRIAPLRRVAVGVLLFLAFLLPCGTINPFNAMDQGPDTWPTEADAWRYIFEMFGISVVLIFFAHIVGRRPRKRPLAAETQEGPSAERNSDAKSESEPS